MKRQFDFIDVPSGPSIPMWLFSPHLPSTSGSIGTGSAPLSSRDATPMHANLTAKPELDGPCDVPSHEALQPSAPASPTYPLPSPPLPSPHPIKPAAPHPPSPPPTSAATPSKPPQQPARSQRTRPTCPESPQTARRCRTPRPGSPTAASAAGSAGCRPGRRRCRAIWAGA